MILERRKFLAACGKTALAVAGGYVVAVNPAQAAEDEEGEGDIGPVEDLMREHGVLRRVLLIYEEGSAQHRSAPGFSRQSVSHRRAAHPQLHRGLSREERGEVHLPEAAQRSSARPAATFRSCSQQHQAGRKLTDKSFASSTSNAKDTRLVDPVTQFIRMYRPHAAREDTIVFPAFHQAVSEKEFDAIGEQMEKQEEKLFGEGGFAKIVEAVAEEERALGHLRTGSASLPKIEAN